MTRVRTQGYVTVSFNTVHKDFKRLGYDVSPSTVAKLSEFPVQSFVPQDNLHQTASNRNLQQTEQKDRLAISQRNYQGRETVVRR